MASSLFHQQRLDRLQVIGGKGTVGLAQLQPAEQHVITRPGQIALGLEQLALRVQDIDIDAYGNIGSVYNSMGDYSEALKYYKECL